MRFLAPPFPRGATAATAGFTLIEVMAAVAILAIALLALLRANNQSVLLRAHAQEITTATLLAQERLAAARSDLDNLEDESDGDFGESFPSWRWTLEKEEVDVPFDFAALEPVKTVSDVQPDAAAAPAAPGTGGAAGAGAAAKEEHGKLQKLTLTVFWPAGVKEDSLTFTEYFAESLAAVEGGQAPNAPPGAPGIAAAPGRGAP